MECLCTMEDITEEDSNYCEYQTMPSGSWRPCRYSVSVVRRLISTQFSEYVSGVRKADCEADLKRRIGSGPPIWLADKHALPLPEDDTHVCRIWTAVDGQEYSAKLHGCVEVRRPLPHDLPDILTKPTPHLSQGAERQALWDELKSFLIPKEGDTDSTAEDDATSGRMTAPLDDLKIS
jgi:hypothetical protein